MKRTVKQLAQASGISIRTLHHYHAIGLLPPAEVGGNGYRYYGRAEMLRLQQILFFRELGFELECIATLLDAPDFDVKSALVAHREAFEARIARMHRLVDTIDRTVATLDEERIMKDAALFDGFDAPKQARYEAEVGERFGPRAAAAVEAARGKHRGWNERDKAAFVDDIRRIEGGLAAAMGDGEAFDSRRVRDLLAQHHAWVARSWPSPPTATAYAGLADFYESHEDFIARYEAIAPGFARWLAAAVRHYARSQLPPG